jgi:tight adherence protein C
MEIFLTDNSWLIFLGAFAVIFLLSFSVSQFVRQNAARHKMVDRIKGGNDNITITADSVATSPEAINKRLSILAFFGRLGGLLAPAKPKDFSSIRLKYLRAGIRITNAASVFWGVKIFLAVTLPTIFLLSRLYVFKLMTYQATMLTAILIALLGFYLPDIWLRYKTDKRREKILKSLPDSLDLLVVCVEAGMGLDAAINRVARETKLNSPELSDELHLTTLEMRAGKRRQDTLRNLALRTSLDELNNLVTLLIQTDKFGTNIADALRTYSDFYRTERQQKAEELAAKLPVKLIFPLMFFIFPSLMLAILGPALIAIYKSFGAAVGQ